ncbi:uncharacterized protein [Venturia canescens]|uniref:uncharacterized protein n=1 Tax=Venturia canescens TaxID=32260 RepID=UPI001C9D11BB|nr:uncharacterized protein LOC122417428 [Venturia canescens]
MTTSTTKEFTATTEEFTSNEEMDEFIAGDETIYFTGYIDSIEGSKLVGKGVKKVLYKFVVNNGKGRKMRVLMWEEVTKKYEASLRCRDIIRIWNGKALAVNPNFANASDDVIAVELSVQRSTRVDIMGQFKTEEQQCYTRVLLRNSTADSNQLIVVEGFIKVPFFTSTTGNSIYGMGAITDGQYKLRVHIAQYSDIESLGIGAHIEVRGEIRKDKFGSPYLQAKDMGQIIIVDSEIMSDAELRNGF